LVIPVEGLETGKRFPVAKPGEQSIGLL